MSPETYDEKNKQIGATLPNFLPSIYRDYYTSVLTGQYRSPTTDEINTATEAYFSYPLLTPISVKRKKILSNYIKNRIEFSCRYREELAGEVFLIENQPKKNETYFRENFRDFKGLIVGPRAKEIAALFEITEPINSKEKEKLLTDPDYYANAQITNGSSFYWLLGNGTRPLCYEQGKDNYGYRIEDFTSMLTQVRAAQGKNQEDKLLGLDIGGSNGLGASDAEKLDPNLDVTNITFDPEFAFWPLRGGHRILLAECFPKDLSEKFDVIFSHLAFRYMRYRDIALENAIRALHVGGILNIFFSSDYDHRGEDEDYQRIANEIDAQFKKMEVLQRKGIIKYLPTLHYNAREDWLKEKGEVHGTICLQKTGSLKC